MKHPTTIWIRIETWVNSFLERFLPRRLLRWLWILGYTGLSCAILLFSTLPVLICVSVASAILVNTGSETIHKTDAACINPALEGKLVQIHGKITTTCTITDPDTGIQAQVPWMQRFTDPCKMPPDREMIELMSRWNTSVFHAPEFQLGAFHFQGKQPDWYISAYTSPLVSGLQIANPPAGLVLTPTDTGSGTLQLSTTEGKLLGHIEYRTTDDIMYVTGRQMGNEILMPFISTHAWQERSLSDYLVMEDYTCIIITLVGSCAVFALLCLAFSCIRAGLRHITPDRDWLRYPLWEAALRAAFLIVGTGCSLFLFIASQIRDLSPYASSPRKDIALALLLLVVVFLLLLQSILRWRSLGAHPRIPVA